MLGQAIGLCVEEAGYEVAGVAQSVDAALTTLACRTVDAALLDVSLQRRAGVRGGGRAGRARRAVRLRDGTAGVVHSRPHRHRPLVPSHTTTPLFARRWRACWAGRAELVSPRSSSPLATRRRMPSTMSRTGSLPSRQAAIASSIGTVPPRVSRRPRSHSQSSHASSTGSTSTSSARPLW